MLLHLGQPFTVEDIDGPLCAEHCNLGGWPGIDQVGAHILAAHHDVGAAIGLAGDNADLGHRRLRIGVDDLGPVADDATVLLHGSRHKARTVYKGDQGDAKGIAEADKSRDLVRGIDVQHAGQPGGLVGNDTYNLTVEPRKAHHGVASKESVHFEKAALWPASAWASPVKNARDDLADVVRVRVFQRNQFVQQRICPIRLVCGWQARGRSGIVRRQIAKQFPGRCKGLVLISHYKMGDPADGGMCLRAPQCLKVHILAGHRLDHFRPRDEHVADALSHDDKVCEARGIDRTPGTGSQHHTDLGDDPAGLGIAPEELTVARQAPDALLDARANRVIEKDKGSTGTGGQIQDLADFLRLCL